MMQAYKRRPHDFKRKILSRGIHTRDSLLNEEFRFLCMIEPDQLGKRYYNLKNTKDYYWHTDDNSRLTVSEKISIRTREAMQRPEVRAKYEEAMAKVDNSHKSDPLVIEKRRASMIKTMSKKFPEENRRKPLTKEERNQYYINKAKAMHSNRSKEQKLEISRKLSEANKRNPRPPITCPHCQKLGNPIVMKRWHFDNCKAIGG
jgi:hypothetical protein